MSAETIPDQRHLGHVQALGHEARPDQHVEAARGEGIEHPVGGSPALDDVAVEPRDPQPWEPRPHLALQALGAPAEVADPRRGAGGAAARQRPGASAVVAPQGRPGLVVDERAVAVRARLDRSAIAAQHDRGGATPVDDQDRPIATHRCRAARGHPRARRDSRPRLPAASSARRSTDVTLGSVPAGRAGSRTRRYLPARAWPTLSTDGVALPRTTAAPARVASSIAASRAWNRGVRSLL